MVEGESKRMRFKQKLEDIDVTVCSKIWSELSGDDEDGDSLDME